MPFSCKKLSDYMHTRTDICINMCVYIQKIIKWYSFLIIYILFLIKNSSFNKHSTPTLFLFPGTKTKTCVKVTVRDIFKPK